MQYPIRVNPADVANLSPRQEQIRIKMGPFGEEPTSNMMRTFLNYPEFCRSIGRIGTRVTLTTDLPARMAALASLRTVWLCGCEYLWAQVRDEARTAGITEPELQAIATGNYATLNSIETHVVEAIDEMHDTHYLTEEKWYRINLLGSTAIMDIIMTYAFFVTLSVAVNSMGVPLEEGQRGWDLPWTPSVNAGTGLTALHELPKRVFEADYALLTPAQIEVASRLGRRGKPTTSKLQKAMINYPVFMQALAAFGKRGIDDSSLPMRIWQIACMRTVWLCDSEYLWAQHGKVCLTKLGVTPEILAGVAEGPGAKSLEGIDQVMVAAVDDMYYDNRISDENWEKINELGPEAVTDLVIVFGLYVLQSCVARCFGTTLEEGVPGFPPELDRFREGHRRS